MTVQCTRCGRESTALAEAPFRDDMGREILEKTRRECWAEWLSLQVKIINEQGLLPVNPEHGEILERNLREFLQLPSASGETLDEVGDPPTA